MKAEYVGRKPAPPWMQRYKQGGMPEEVGVWRVTGWFRRPRLVWGLGGWSLYDAETGKQAGLDERLAVAKQRDGEAAERADRENRDWWDAAPFVEGIPEMPERVTMPRKPEPPPNLRYKGGEVPKD